MPPVTRSQARNRPNLIQRLPNELLAQIANHLGDPDLQALRQVGRRVEEGVRHEFGARHFRERKLELNRRNLTTLIDISESRMAQWVHIVYLRIGYFTNFFRTNIINGVSNGSSTCEIDDDRMHEYETMLVQAFSNLHHLQTVGVDDRSFQDPNRNASVRLSWEEVIDTFGHNRCEGAKDEYFAQVLRILLTAMAASNSQITHLDLSVRWDGMAEELCFGLVDEAFHLSNTLKMALVPILGNLARLSTPLHLDADRMGPNDRGENNRSRYIQEFLSLCPNLRQLDLDAKHRSLAGEQLLWWLAKRVPVQGDNPPQAREWFPAWPPVPAASFPFMKKLILWNFVATPATMKDLMRKVSSTLRDLDCRNLAFYGDLHPVNFNLWAPWLQFLANNTTLESFYFDEPMAMMRPDPQEAPRRASRRVATRNMYTRPDYLTACRTGTVGRYYYEVVGRDPGDPGPPLAMYASRRDWAYATFMYFSRELVMRRLPNP